MSNLKIDTIPSDKWELTNKKAKVYLYYYGAYQKNEKFVPNNIFADKTQPPYVWKETTKLYLDSDIRFKYDLAFTVVKLVSISDGRETTIKIIDDCYSIKGVVVKTIELYSFEGECAPLYIYYLKKYMELAKKVDDAIRANKTDTITELPQKTNEEKSANAKQLYEQAESLCEGKEKKENSLKDSHKAFRLFQEAAQMGDAEAQCCLGCCYRNGYGIQVDHKQARYWYDKSSSNGCLRALFHVARIYENGQGVPQSYEKAVEWYTKAAEQGYARAQFNLGGLT